MLLAEIVEPFNTKKGFYGVGEKITISLPVAERLKKKIRLIKNESVDNEAKIVNGELLLLHPVDDLAALIVGLTENNLELQKQLLLKHCQAYDLKTHFWALKEKWEEKAAILEYDAGLKRENAELKAAEMYHLLAFMSELRQEDTIK